MHNKLSCAVFKHTVLDLLHRSKGICLCKYTKEKKCVCICMAVLSMFFFFTPTWIHKHCIHIKQALQVNIINQTLTPTHSNAAQIIYANSAGEYLMKLPSVSSCILRIWTALRLYSTLESQSASFKSYRQNKTWENVQMR